MADQNWPNLAAMFYEQVDAYGDRPFLWAKREGTYKPLSWGDVAARVTPLARGLLQTGIKPGDRRLHNNTVPRRRQVVGVYVPPS